MKQLGYTTRDRTGWGPGPWDEEPDKVQWEDESTGLPCLAVRNHYGAWCGYVGVPPGHRHFGKHYDDVDAGIHGGLTYSGRSNAPAGSPQRISHLPEPGEPEELWWLGFDCNHYDDFAPALFFELNRNDPFYKGGEGTVYRTLAYVKEQCTELARQIA